MLQRLPGAEVTFVGRDRGSIRTDNGFLGLSVDAAFDEVHAADVLVVPGGIGCRALLDDEQVLSWVRSIHETTRYTTSVCTGSLVMQLWEAGKLDLDGTHWANYGALRDFGALPTPQRVVEHLDRRIITAAGVSSGIDMALRLSELLFDADAARAMQLMIEYDPEPPFDAGSVDKAGDAVMTRVVEYARDKQ